MPLSWTEIIVCAMVITVFGLSANVVAGLINTKIPPVRTSTLVAVVLVFIVLAAGVTAYQSARQQPGGRADVSGPSDSNAPRSPPDTGDPKDTRCKFRSVEREPLRRHAVDKEIAAPIGGGSCPVVDLDVETVIGRESAVRAVYRKVEGPARARWFEVEVAVPSGDAPDVAKRPTVTGAERDENLLHHAVRRRSTRAGTRRHFLRGPRRTPS